jgi:hypothetical protein
MMLDAHPELAIPPETWFLPDCLGVRDAASFMRTVTATPTWPDHHLDAGALAAAVARLAPFGADEAARAFYRLYAARFGKRRWGDKSPQYSLNLREVETLLPEARFVHIIRDGRDVALSVRHLWFAPGSTVEELAADWRDRIERARRDARRVRHYLEVRYEELIADAPSVLRRICAHVELSYDDAMLRYPERASARLDEHEERRDAAGNLLVSKEGRRELNRHARLPPQPSRVGRWREQMAPAERARFARTAGKLLRGLGYDA